MPQSATVGRLLGTYLPDPYGGPDVSKMTVVLIVPDAFASGEFSIIMSACAPGGLAWLGMITGRLARSVRGRGGWRGARPRGGRTGTLGKGIYAAPLRLSGGALRGLTLLTTPRDRYPPSPP